MSDRARRHIELFNRCQQSGDWETFVQAFTEDAAMDFVGAPAGPFQGRPAILDAYRSQPPTGTMTVGDVTTDGDTDTVRFAWDSGGTGTMTITWSGEQVAALEVEFD